MYAHTQVSVLTENAYTTTAVPTSNLKIGDQKKVLIEKTEKASSSAWIEWTLRPMQTSRFPIIRG